MDTLQIKDLKEPNKCKCCLFIIIYSKIQIFYFTSLPPLRNSLGLRTYKMFFVKLVAKIPYNATPNFRAFGKNTGCPQKNCAIFDNNSKKNIGLMHLMDTEIFHFDYLGAERKWSLKLVGFFQKSWKMANFQFFYWEDILILRHSLQSK